MTKNKKSELMCIACLPAMPLKDHPTYNGIMFHSRLDYPADTICLLNEDAFKTRPIRQGGDSLEK